MKVSLLVATVIFLLFSTVRADPPEARWTHSDPTTHTVTFTVHYPSYRLCDSCVLNIASTVNKTSWDNYLPETGNPEYLAKRRSEHVYVFSQTFNSYQVGQEHLVSVYYNAWAAKSNDTQAHWLNNNCRNVLNNWSGNNKGKQITFVLPDSDLELDIYPYFCDNRGSSFPMTIPSPQIAGTPNMTVIVRRPGSMEENPLSRASRYLIQLDGFATEDSLGLQYDEAMENGLTPELVTLGLQFGTDYNPWSDNGNQRRYLLSPYPCVDPAPAPSCAAWGGPWGGAFQLGDFLYNAALPAVWNALGMTPVGRNNLMISGYSLGGSAACILAYQNSSRWSGAYCGSGSFWQNDQQFAKIVKTQKLANPVKFYIDIGGREQPLMIDVAKAAYNALLNRDEFNLGENLMYAPYLNGPDSHQFNSWSARTPEALAFLYNDPVKIGSGHVGNQATVTLAYGDKSRPFHLSAVFTIPAGPKSAQKQGAIEGQ